MPAQIKRNTIIVCLLAAFFYWAFMFAKHNPSLRPVIPFGDDPYDAVGSFGVIAGGIIALIAPVRSFRRYRRQPSAAQRVYVIRAQTAVVLAVLITVMADAIAMLRHPSMWLGAASRNELIALLGALTVAAVAVQALIHASQEKTPGSSSRLWLKAGLGLLLAALVLAMYPESLIRGLLSHLLTVVIGAIVLFAPLRLLLVAAVPGDFIDSSAGSRSPRGRHRWGLVLLVAIVVGGFAFIGEMSEGGSAAPVARVALVASVFIGLAIAGILIAYAFLGKPLGFGPGD